MAGVDATLVLIIIMSVCALALLALEAFIPGAGLIGVIGAALMIAGTVISWRAYGALAGIGLFAVCGALAFIIMRLIFRSMKKGRLSSMFMSEENTPAVFRKASPPESGSEGIALTALHPSGIAEFDGERVHVSAENSFIEAGVRIIAVRSEGTRIIVTEKENG